MQTFQRVVSVALVTAFLLLACGTAAYAEQACSNKSAKGIYGYSCNGVAPNALANPVNPPIQPFAAYGVVTGDGRGQWNGHGKVSFNGAVVGWTHNTTLDDPAVVNRDCTGSVTYKVEIVMDDLHIPVADAHFEFVIVDDGREIKGFPIDQGYAVTCQLILESGKNAVEP